VSGEVQEVFVRSGQTVKEGQRLVQMENPALRYRARQLQHQIEQVDALLRSALSEDPASYEMQRRRKKKLVEELHEIEERIERLVLCAPFDGVVVSLHGQEMRIPAFQHGFVQFPDEDAASELGFLEGTTVAAGTGILAVAANDAFQFEAFVYEHDVSLLSPGRDMSCLLRAHPSAPFKTRIRSMAPVDVKSIQNVGITLADVGWIPVRRSPDGQQEPLVTLYVVRSEPQYAREDVEWGMTGKASITYGSGPMGSFYFNRLLRALKLRLQRI